MFYLNDFTILNRFQFYWSVTTMIYNINIKYDFDLQRINDDELINLLFK